MQTETAEAGRPKPEARVVVYPEHGTGRAAKLTTCHHCGGKPLLVRKCGRNRSCAVCQKCGFHHRTKLTH